MFVDRWIMREKFTGFINSYRNASNYVDVSYALSIFHNKFKNNWVEGVDLCSMGGIARKEEHRTK